MGAKPKLNNKPLHAQIQDGRTTDAWYYENARNVEVHVDVEGTGHFVVRLHRAKLADWIKRTAHL